MLALLIFALTPPQAALRALADADLRVATTGDRLARGGQAFCPGQTVSLGGMVLQDIRQYPKREQADARAALGLGNGPTVVGVAADSSASGLIIPGDVILAADGVVPADSKAGDPYGAVAAVETLVEMALVRGTTDLRVRRNGREVVVGIEGQVGCATRFQIVPRLGLNGQADGRYVQVGGKLMDFVASDDELAAVMAHELAHNILQHNVSKTPSKRAEYEADRLSVWLVARAGYDVDAIIPFWTRLGKRTDYGIFADGTHPGWKKRIAALADAVALLRAQRAAGVPLAPPPVSPPQQQSTSQGGNRR